MICEGIYCDLCTGLLGDDCHAGHEPTCPNYCQQQAPGYPVYPCDCELYFCPACCPECKEAAFVEELNGLISDVAAAGGGYNGACEWGAGVDIAKKELETVKQALVDFILADRRAK